MIIFVLLVGGEWLALWADFGGSACVVIKVIVQHPPALRAARRTGFELRQRGDLKHSGLTALSARV